jgi:hypothetical protein
MRSCLRDALTVLECQTVVSGPEEVAGFDACEACRGAVFGRDAGPDLGRRRPDGKGTGPCRMVASGAGPGEPGGSGCRAYQRAAPNAGCRGGVAERSPAPAPAQGQAASVVLAAAAAGFEVSDQEQEMKLRTAS